MNKLELRDKIITEKLISIQIDYIKKNAKKYNDIRKAKDIKILCEASYDALKYNLKKYKDNYNIDCYLIDKSELRKLKTIINEMITLNDEIEIRNRIKREFNKFKINYYNDIYFINCYLINNISELV